MQSTERRTVEALEALKVHNFIRRCLVVYYNYLFFFLYYLSFVMNKVAYIKVRFKIKISTDNGYEETLREEREADNKQL